MLRVSFFRPAITLDPAESGEAFVFRDFERSRVAAIRNAVLRKPAKATLLYIMAVVLWTMLLTTGSQLYGDGRLAVNLTPHVALFTVILGFFFYPLRLIWIPVLVFVATFLYPFFPIVSAGARWHDLPEMSVSFGAQLFALNLVSGLVIGLGYRVIYAAGHGRLRPHSLDLFTTCAGYFLFAVVCLAQAALMLRLADTLPEAVRLSYGFTPDYELVALKRILRGSVVVSVFLLAAVELPRPGQYLRTLALAALFPAIVPLQAAGLVIQPQIDVIVLAFVVVLTSPAGVGIHSVTFGMASYAALTGQFLDDLVGTDTAAAALSAYSLVGLTLLALTMVVKGQSDHRIHEKDAIIHKLDRARDFAGVGLFAVNHGTGRFRLDEAAQRMLGLPAGGPLSVFMASFMPGDRPALLDAFAAARSESRSVEMHMASASGAANVLRCFVWTDRTASGERAAYGILLDMTEAEERETRLRAALSALSQREEKQRQLFSIISHELRTPASVISLVADEMADRGGNSPLERQLREATDQLLTVLDDMRQAVNPEKNLPVKLVPYIPADLAESLTNAMALTARDKGITIRLDMGQGAARPRVGDVTRVRQALTNLIRNALIHSGGRTITLSWQAGPPVADFMPVSEWRIEDDGIGIPESEVDRLFEPFERGSKDPRKSADGSGLGLYIARSSIQMLGGSLDHYRPDGGGTGYVIHLPEALSTQPLAPKAPPIAPVPAQDRPWTVLLAEDNALVAEITRARLEKLSAQVTHAADGRAALEMIRQATPDLVITDLFMPEMDGDDLIRTLRQDGYKGPIIGLTAAVVGEEMNRFRTAGANVVMKKPLDFEMMRGFLRDGFPLPPPPAETGSASG